MEKLNGLLKQVSEILVQERTQREEKRGRGECFNIFEILGLQTSEVRLHSAIIAELLNPNGNHGLGDKFLKAFIDDIIAKQLSFNLDTSSTDVFVEYPIGPISEGYTEGGRIDILLKDKYKQTIIIENKIYAGDQKYQLLRYHNYARQCAALSNEEYVILYLTLDGGQASEDSVGKEDFRYYSISYRKDILTWLKHCLCIAVLQPLVRETIQQYINNLKTIFSIMDNNNTEVLMNVLTSKENVETTISIIEQSWEIQKRIRANFVNQIKTYCDDLNYRCEYDEEIINCEHDKWIRIFEEPYKNVIFRIGVVEHTNNGGFLMDVTIPSSYKIKNRMEFTIWPDAAKPTDNNPIGWAYFWSESGIGGSGRWWRWDDWNTLKDMADGKMFSFVRKIIDNIRNQDVFRRINDGLELNQ
ncbi:MAG: PD-(D/E)XK nuclease family protein [Bacteroidales bacterium]|nr:PD-(D/E)XK nuclease family protein [Bacteroidales bacterium]